MSFSSPWQKWGVLLGLMASLTPLEGCMAHTDDLAIQSDGWDVSSSTDSLNQEEAAPVPSDRLFPRPQKSEEDLPFRIPSQESESQEQTEPVNLPLEATETPDSQSTSDGDSPVSWGEEISPTPQASLEEEPASSPEAASILEEAPVLEEIVIWEETVEETTITTTIAYFR